MILVDFNQLVIAQLFGAQAAGLKTPNGVDETKLLNMVTSQLLKHQANYGKEFGKLIICCDGKSDKYWRKTLFPNYKSNRVATQTIANIAWDQIFKAIDSIREIIIDSFPGIKVLRYENAEADDIIAVLTKYAYHTESVMIISADKDFGQLHLEPDLEKLLGHIVRQYSPIQQKMVECKDPKELLFTHIIKGDRGDGIPNIRSGADTIKLGIRQESITKVNLTNWVKALKGGADLDSLFGQTYVRSRYDMNAALIDFEYIPEYLATEIIKDFTEKKK